MNQLLFVLTLLALCSCFNKNSNDQKTIIKHPIDTSYVLIDSFGSIYSDTSHFTILKCGLYINSKKEIAFKAEDRSEKSEPEDIYLTSIYWADLADTIDGGPKEMKYVVDTATFQIVSGFYLKDKNHIYNFNPMSDGGTIEINWKGDTRTFSVLQGGAFAKDKNHCYYRGNIIKGADVLTFKVLDTSYS